MVSTIMTSLAHTLHVLREGDERASRDEPCIHNTDWTEIEAQMLAALPVLQSEGKHELEMEVLWRLAQACYQQGQIEDEEKWLRAMLPLVNAAGHIPLQFL